MRVSGTLALVVRTGLCFCLLGWSAKGERDCSYRARFHMSWLAVALSWQPHHHLNHHVNHIIIK